MPNALPARMECHHGCELPALLSAKGWIVSDGGTTEVFLPVSAEMKLLNTNTVVTRDHLVPTTVSIFSVDLPR
jgi:hypothetical protein